MNVFKAPSDTAAVIVAAGSGARSGQNIPKQYCNLMGISVLERTLTPFLRLFSQEQIFLVINPAHHDYYADIADRHQIQLIEGGDTRSVSVKNAIDSLDGYTHVLIHDAARPFVTQKDIQSTLTALAENDAVTLAMPLSDTVHRFTEDQLSEVITREGLYAVQTPQGFFLSVLKSAYAKGNHTTGHTDDAGLVHAAGYPVKYVLGGAHNFKLTHPEDFTRAENILSAQIETRVGYGFDIHAFAKESADSFVMLGGVKVPCPAPVIAHSDGDVVLHALTDALLGTIGAGDIGVDFPPSDSTFKDWPSIRFIESALEKVRAAGGSIINIDMTVLSEIPKIGPYREQIVKSVAGMLDLSPQRVNIKATTFEKIGKIGRKEGIAAQAAVSIQFPRMKTDAR